MRTRFHSRASLIPWDAFGITGGAQSGAIPSYAAGMWPRFRVAQRRETVVVERNQTVIARLVPAEPMMTAAQALEGLPTNLDTEAAARWLHDSRDGYEEGGRDPWT